MHKKVLLTISVFCFAIAIFIDGPYPQWPTDGERQVGNFFVSTGFFFLALGLLSW